MDKKNNNNNPNSSNYDNDSYIFRSRSQKNRKKNNTFTLSIPTNRKEDEVELEYLNKRRNYNTLKKIIKNNDVKGNKKNPESSNNNIYSDANSYNKFTPFKDYSVNWEEGNSTCPQIIKNHSMPDYNNLIEYNPLENQRKTKTYRRHYKKNSAPENMPRKNAFYSNTNKSSNYIDSEYYSKRKNLFV